MTVDLKQRGYLRFPTLAGDRLVFMAEDDLWAVGTGGGVARRLTTSLSSVTAPVLSPDGKWLVFAAAEDGPQELYVMPADGGETTKLTHLGANTVPSGWHPNGDILFTTDAESPFAAWRFPYRMGRGGQPEALPWGPAQHVAVSVDGGIALARNGRDAAYWKRYRGGTAGHFWVQPAGEDQFTRWSGPNGNLSNPMWVAGRLYFLSDHEGIGNVYSALPDGTDVRRHTDHETYYARNAQSDGRRIVYHAGGDVYVYDPFTDEATRVPIVLHSAATQRARRFVSGAHYIESADIHPQGHSLLTTVRGRLASFGNWEGPVYTHGDETVGRYRLARWLPDGDRFVAVASGDDGEMLQLHDAGGLQDPVTLQTDHIGLIVSLHVAPKGTKLALANHRNELFVIDWDSGEQTLVERNEYGSVSGVTWSPDGNWLAYAAPFSKNTTGINLWQQGNEPIRVTEPVLADMAPSFDPEGKYLYFLSARVFNPVYDALQFDLGFVNAIKPCLITLQDDTPSPFMPAPRPVVEGRPEPPKRKEEPADEDNESELDEETSESPGELAAETPAPTEEPKDDSAGIRIDLDGITRRVLMFPVPEANYRAIAGIDGKVLLLSHPLRPAVNPNPMARPTLHAYDLRELKLDTLAQGVTGFSFSFDYKTAVLRYDKRVRVLAAGRKPDDKPQANSAAAFNRVSGWVNLDRIKVAVHPEQEWRHMLREAWHLQRYRFWTDNMSSVDWDTVWERYSALLPRVATRSDVSDLMWEMQGELGTSHAYESGGDYRRGPNYGQGFLGAGFRWDADAGGYRIESIVQGDGWADDSALLLPGVQLAVGDVVTAIDNRRLSEAVTPHMCLIGKAGHEVGLRVLPAEGDDVRTVTVKALDRGADVRARYRDWVETNRRRVHEASGGRLGYVHVPDMVGHGFAEFHRSWLAESERDGLVIDVRHNRGGHVSQLLLEKLSRRAVGFMVTRWGRPQTYPHRSVMGPLVAVTNERAGSDGDIFSHSFKLMGLGPLIGKRTWGGVIGIAPRHALVDGTVTTQPEFAYWFPDVGWGVENYGTDPDIDVDDRPEQYATGEDAQLDRAIAEALARMDQKPPRWPAFDERPVLTLPKLPPRDHGEAGDDVS